MRTYVLDLCDSILDTQSLRQFMTVIARNDHPATAPVSAEEAQRPKRRDRRVLLAGELSDRQVAALREAEVPADFADLDVELKDWNR